MNAIFDAFKDAWRDRHKLGDRHASKELTAFLPAALEIQETPPNPIAQWLVRALIALLILVLLWASFGEINIVATAHGKILPSSRVKVIQPLDKAVISKILVAEGEYVAKGQPLIELDSTVTGANRDRLSSELHSAEMDLAVNQTLLSMLGGEDDQQEDSEDAFQSEDNKTTQDDKLYRRLLDEKWGQYQSRLSSLQSAVLEAKAGYAATAASVSKLQQILPIVKQRADKVKQLHEKHFASETEYLEFKQESIEIAHDLEMERQRLEQLQAAKDEAAQQVTALRTETRVDALEKITETKRQFAILQEELKKASDLNARQILYAPVAGRVHDLRVTTQGGVVTEAQPIMNIVPDNAALEVEVFLENKDIGFVEKDMLAEIKIHTFPFTKYGIVKAAINTISDDATLDEERGLLYRLLLTMEQDTILVQGREVKLIPGMEVTAEIKTGKRRLMEFFMAPLLQHGKESLRER